MTSLFKSTHRLVRETFFSAVHSLKRKARATRNPQIVTALDTRGYHVVENYWQPHRCDAAIEAIDCLLQQPETRTDPDASPGDERIFAANLLSSAVDLYGDAFLKQLMLELFQTSESRLVGVTLANRIRATAGGVGSGKGWHRDTAIKAQYKAILYLCDVTDQNGAFQYISGSANQGAIYREYLRGTSTILAHRYDQTESPAIVTQNQDMLETFAASAGTLLLVNTRGVHRGMPLDSGIRYALTNYYFIDQIPSHIKAICNEARSHR